MIVFRKGNILKENTEAIVNTVNCVGVMGKGLALQFKKYYPRNFLKYKEACMKNEVRTGKMFVFETGNIFNPKYIINFPTKNHWKNPSKLEYIISGMEDLCNIIVKKDILSIAIPPLGCGNGGLNWNTVKPIILSYVSNLSQEREIIIYES